MTASISSELTHDHERCDALFAKAEQAAHAGDPSLKGSWKGFADAMLRHFKLEEDMLFPALEQAVGGQLPPVRVMLMEHRQMRDLFQQLDEAVARVDVDEFAGLAQTLLVVMEQHNIKEQNILYPMADRALAPQSAALVANMRAVSGGA